MSTDDDYTIHQFPCTVTPHDGLETCALRNSRVRVTVTEDEEAATAILSPASRRRLAAALLQGLPEVVTATVTMPAEDYNASNLPEGWEFTDA